MIEQNNIPSISSKRFLIAILFCAFGSLNAFAQGDKDRTFPEIPKSTDSVNTREGSDATNFESKQDYNYKQNTQVQIKDLKTNNNNPIKKENPLYKHGGEKDIKKEGMSTLSFNLFLYIVDKFREDN